MIWPDPIAWLAMLSASLTIKDESQSFLVVSVLSHNIISIDILVMSGTAASIIEREIVRDEET